MRAYRAFTQPGPASDSFADIAVIRVLQSDDRSCPPPKRVIGAQQSQRASIARPNVRPLNDPG
jgi:hypothetical protein